MIEAVFISDLHLNPAEKQITHRFEAFIHWAATEVKTVYILGDFFHAWPGDDGLDVWSQHIALRLAWLAAQGVQIYFMCGNRDFLIGAQFLKLASMTLLTEPALITLGGNKLLLMHGDSYCTKDKNHQWFRRLTRNKIFSTLFLCVPYQLRFQLVNNIRKKSQMNNHKSDADMEIVIPVMLRHMHQMGVTIIVHGHIHKPGLSQHRHQGLTYQQYVLSDWDDNPLLMCYDVPNGFYFKRLLGG